MQSLVLASADIPWDDILRSASWVLFALAIVIVALLAGWIVVRRGSRPLQVNPHELLTDFRSLKEQGNLTDEEYRRVRLVLDNRIRRQAGMPPIQTEKLPPLPNDDDPGEDFEWREVDLTALGASPPPEPPKEP